MGRHAAGESSGRATGDPHGWRAASRNRRNERRWVCRAVGFTGIGGGGGAAPPPLSRRRVDARDGMRTPSLGVAVWRRASAAARPSRYTPRGHGRGALRSRRSAWRPRRRATTDAHIGPVPVRQQLLRPVLLVRPGRRPRIDCPFAFRRVKKPKADENTTFFPHRPTAPRASPFHRPTENTDTAAGGGSTGRAATAATPWTPTPCPFFPPLRSAERPTRVRGDRGGRPAGRLANPLPRHPPSPPLSPPPPASHRAARLRAGGARPAAVAGRGQRVSRPDTGLDYAIPATRRAGFPAARGGWLPPPARRRPPRHQPTRLGGRRRGGWRGVVAAAAHGAAVAAGHRPATPPPPPRVVAPTCGWRPPPRRAAAWQTPAATVGVAARAMGRRGRGVGGGRVGGVWRKPDASAAAPAAHPWARQAGGPRRGGRRGRVRPTAVAAAPVAGWACAASRPRRGRLRPARRGGAACLSRRRGLPRREDS